MPEDLGIVANGQPAGGTPFSSLPVELQNSSTEAAQNWADADRSYYSAREQQIGPLIGAILSIGGGALAPLLGPLLGGALGVGAGAGTGLLAGGTGALGGIIGGEDPGQALLGGLLSGGGAFAGSQLGSLLGGAGGGAASGAGGAFGSIAPDAGAAAAASGGFTIPELLVNGAGSNLGSLFGGAGGALGGAAGSTGGGDQGPKLNLGGGGDNLNLNQPLPGGTPAQGDPLSNFHPVSLPFGSTDLGSAIGGAAGGAGDQSVSELTVTGQPSRPSGFPGVGIANTGTDPIGGGGPIDSSTPQTQAQPGKADVNKLLQDFFQLIGGAGGASGGVVQSHPSNPTGPAGGGGPGNPTGGQPSSTGTPALGGLGTGGTSAPAPGLLNKGAGLGGAGVGLGGPGQADVRGSTAPDIYPWASSPGGSL